MAPPRAGGARRAQPASDRLFTLGQQGRKTGVTWRDTGVRDEHGMEPIDDIFSSPAKSHNDDDDDDDAYADDREEDGGAEEQQEYDEEDEGDYGEADMDLTTASGPDPAALLNGQRPAMRPVHLAARSPAKTLFGSPPVRSSAGSKAASSGALRRNAAIRQNPALRPPTSPPEARAPQELLSSSPTKPVKRRLDFGKTAAPGAQRKPYSLPPPNGSIAKSQRVRELQYGNGEADDDDHDHDDHDGDGGGGGNGSGGDSSDGEAVGQTSYYNNNHDDSMQMIGGDEVDYNDPEPESPLEEEPVRVKKRGRPPSKAKAAASSAAQQPSTGKKRGRPSRSSGGSDIVLPSREVDDAESGDNEDEDEEDERQSAKRQRVAKAAAPSPPPPPPPPPEPKPKGRPRGRPPTKHITAPTPAEELAESSADAGGDAAPKKRDRKRKSSGVGAATAAAAAVPRGPPLPKSRGLVIRRRGMDDADDGAVKTRSGRNSFRPLAFWRNEHAEFAADVQHDSQGRRIVLPTVQEIVRVEDEELPRLESKSGRHAAGGGGGGGGGGGRGTGRRGRPKGGRRAADDDEDDDGGGGGDHGLEREPWETDPGNVTGEVIVWHTEHELDPPAPGEEVEMAPSEIALSSAAIQTHDVRGGTFRFVKTLSLPFFGTGMVDLPPGTEKRPKNSRKMHMTFFVHYGQVVVMVNDTSFRIAKGGMWSVPRGNYYSIVNDTDRPARIFFAQGCEILTSLEPEEAEANGD